MAHVSTGTDTQSDAELIDALAAGHDGRQSGDCVLGRLDMETRKLLVWRRFDGVAGNRLRSIHSIFADSIMKHLLRHYLSTQDDATIAVITTVIHLAAAIIWWLPSCRYARIAPEIGSRLSGANHFPQRARRRLSLYLLNS